MGVCKHYKSSYKNGEIITSRCIKLNKDVNSMDCFECKHHSSIESEEIPEQALNRNEKPMSRKELFEALSSTFKIIAEQLEDFDKRIKKLEKAERMKS